MVSNLRLAGMFLYCYLFIIIVYIVYIFIGDKRYERLKDQE